MFMAVEAAHPRAMHGNLAAMEADLAFGLAPAVTDAASTAAMRACHGVALLCGFDTPSLTAQGGQRLLP